MLEFTALENDQVVRETLDLLHAQPGGQSVLFVDETDAYPLVLGERGAVVAQNRRSARAPRLDTG